MIKLRIYNDNKSRILIVEQWISLPIDFVRRIYWKIQGDSEFPNDFQYIYQYVENILRDEIKRGDELEDYIIEGETAIKGIYDWTFKRVSKRKLLNYFGCDTMITSFLPQDYEDMIKKTKPEYCLSFDVIDIQRMYELHGLWMEIILFITYTLKDKLRLQTKNYL